MMWLIRPGKEAKYYDKIIKNETIYIPWDGFKLDLSKLETREQFRQTVINEKNPDNPTSIGTWAGQLYTFVSRIKIGDEIIIPSQRSQSYTLAIVSGDYSYNPDEEDGLYHSRKIDIVCKGIPRSAFSQGVLFAFGTFRTLFNIKYRDEVLETVNSWMDSTK